MDLTGEIDFDSDLVAGQDGFSRTTPATSRALYYVTDDRGKQIVGRLSDGGKLTVRVRCLGNAVLAPRRAASVTLRTR